MGSGSVSVFFFFFFKPLGGANTTTVQAVSTLRKIANYSVHTEYFTSRLRVDCTATFFFFLFLTKQKR